MEASCQNKNTDACFLVSESEIIIIIIIIIIKSV